MGIIEAIKKIERERERNEGGIEKGVEKGRYEQSIIIARELKKEGLPVEFISRTTGLTVKVVTEL